MKGFPIRKSPDRNLFDDSPKLIAANHVLLRPLPPRHPPYALNNLIILLDCYGVFKEHFISNVITLFFQN